MKAAKYPAGGVQLRAADGAGGGCHEGLDGFDPCESEPALFSCYGSKLKKKLQNLKTQRHTKTALVYGLVPLQLWSPALLPDMSWRLCSLSSSDHCSDTLVRLPFAPHDSGSVFVPD